MSESCIYDTVRESSAVGRSTRTIRCPFCGCEVEAYTWSLAGSGKRCECGAVHNYYGTTTRKDTP